MTNEDAIHILLNSNEYHHAKGDLPHSAASVEAFNKAIEALKAERPHGEWLKYLYYAQEDRWECICSICGKLNRQESNFCPNCGASMQKGGAE